MQLPVILIVWLIENRAYNDVEVMWYLDFGNLIANSFLGI